MWFVTFRKMVTEYRNLQQAQTNSDFHKATPSESRYTFTTGCVQGKLVASGLLGPVRILISQN